MQGFVSICFFLTFHLKNAFVEPTLVLHVFCAAAADDQGENKFNKPDADDQGKNRLLPLGFHKRCDIANCGG